MYIYIYTPVSLSLSLSVRLPLCPSASFPPCVCPPCDHRGRHGAHGAWWTLCLPTESIRLPECLYIATSNGFELQAVILLSRSILRTPKHLQTTSKEPTQLLQQLDVLNVRPTEVNDLTRVPYFAVTQLRSLRLAHWAKQTPSTATW